MNEQEIEDAAVKRMSETVQAAVKAAKTAMVAEADKADTSSQTVGVIILATMGLMQNVIAATTGEISGKPDPMRARQIITAFEDMLSEPLQRLYEVAANG